MGVKGKSKEEHGLPGGFRVWGTGLMAVPCADVRNGEGVQRGSGRGRVGDSHSTHENLPDG